MSLSPQNIRAEARYLHNTPRKMRFVADIIRGMPVAEAEAQLILSPRRPSDALLKLLRSALANAKHNFKLDKNTFFIKEIRVDGGPSTKRWMPRAQGRVSAIQKKMSHVTLILGIMDKTTESRFVIAQKPKKDALPKKGGTKEKHQKHNEKTAQEERSAPEKPTFFKRVFRRKSI